MNAAAPEASAVIANPRASIFQVKLQVSPRPVGRVSMESGLLTRMYEIPRNHDQALYVASRVSEIDINFATYLSLGLRLQL